MSEVSRQREQALSQVLEARILPVIVIDEVDVAKATAHALRDGGLNSGEVTMRTERALDCLAAMAEVSGFVVGAGTVCSAAQARDCIRAGATFLVSPGLSEEVLRVADQHDVPLLAGVATPTEVMKAQDLGLGIVKLFPAAQIGGPSAVRALSSPFPKVRFVPTGGVDKSNAQGYLEQPAVAAVGGSWITSSEFLRDRNFGAITRSAQEARQLSEAMRESP